MIWPKDQYEDALATALEYSEIHDYKDGMYLKLYLGCNREEGEDFSDFGFVMNERFMEQGLYLQIVNEFDDEETGETVWKARISYDEEFVCSILPFEAVAYFVPKR